MQLPIVTAYEDHLRDLLEKRCQLHHFQHSLTGLIALDNNSLANISRCVLGVQCPPPALPGEL